MDEKVLEKIITRSFIPVIDRKLRLVSAISLFIAGIFWLCCRAAVGHVVGALHMPLLIFSFAVALFPIVPFISPIALLIVSLRKKDPSISIHDAFRACWKPSTALLLQGVLLVAIELALVIVSIVWNVLDGVPVFGSLVHLFSSWIPSCLSFIMLCLLLGFCLISPFIGTSFVVSPERTKGTGWKEILPSFSSNWLLRLKMCLLGYIPIFFVFTFFTGWDFASQISSTEFCASIFRLAVFSIIFAPFFLFLVHMAVEAERYCIWLSQKRD
jgi:hypothetical protein